MAAINVLNLPKPFEGYEQSEIVEAIRTRDPARIVAAASAQVTKAARKKDPNTQPVRVSADVAVSSTLRGAIIAHPGKRLVIGDYAAVEAAFLFTIAHQWDVVEQMRQKADIYCEFGSGVLGRRITKDNDSLLRSVFKEGVLGCGFGMGLPKFEARLEFRGIDVDPQIRAQAHAGYRSRFPRVPEFWKGVEQAAKAAIRHPGTTYSYNEISYVSDGYWLVCALPSGRSFYYPNARLQPGKFGEEIVYEGWTRLPDGRRGPWGDSRTWGGTLTENICQAGCRDIMAEDELEVEALPGWQMTMTVYDELVAECPDSLPPGEGTKQLLAIMSQPPRWLPAMPVSAAGFEAFRYRKD